VRRTRTRTNRNPRAAARPFSRFASLTSQPRRLRHATQAQMLCKVQRAGAPPAAFDCMCFNTGMGGPPTSGWDLQCCASPRCRFVDRFRELGATWPGALAPPLLTAGGAPVPRVRPSLRTGPGRTFAQQSVLGSSERPAFRTKKARQSRTVPTATAIVWAPHLPIRLRTTDYSLARDEPHPVEQSSLFARQESRCRVDVTF